MGWIERKDIEYMLNYNKSFEALLTTHPYLKKDYYILANMVAAFVNMLIYEDGEDFAIEFRKYCDRQLRAAQFSVTKKGAREATNIHAIWGVIRKKGLDVARKKAVSKKHESIKESMRETLQNLN